MSMWLNCVETLRRLACVTCTRAGCHLVVAVVDSKVEDLRVWRTTNHVGHAPCWRSCWWKQLCNDLNRIMGD